MATFALVEGSNLALAITHLRAYRNLEIFPHIELAVGWACYRHTGFHLAGSLWVLELLEVEVEVLQAAKLNMDWPDSADFLAQAHDT